MRKSRGIGLLVMFGFMSVFLTMVILSNQFLNQAVRQVEKHKRERAAATMAQAGLDYARNQIRREHWLTARRFQSPALGPGESFEVEISPTGPERWAISVVGYSGSTTHRVEGRYP